MFNKKYLAFVCVIMGFGPVAAQQDLSLTIKVVGAKPGIGQAIVSLFTKENYLKDPIVEKTILIDGSGGAEVLLNNLSPATYAFSVVYDENNDGKLNTGLFGIPTEKIAMSNNARGRFGPPSFNKTSFSMTESRTMDVLLSKAKE